MADKTLNYLNIELYLHLKQIRVNIILQIQFVPQSREANSFYDIQPLCGKSLEDGQFHCLILVVQSLRHTYRIGPSFLF